MSTRIYSVDLIDLTLLKSLPSKLLVMATGRTSSSGWSSIELSPFIYVQPPADGILDCDMVGTPPAPGQTVLPVLVPVSADILLDNVENYWGPDQPLTGVRIHAAANAKTALVGKAPKGMPEMRLVASTSGGEIASPSFDADIKPLFRVRDAAVMKAISSFDLHVYEDVAKAADRILARLEDGTMPCDGEWPETDIALFKRWIDAGKPA
ncbi:hypothetical protein [Stappia sp. MMSF_3263]|uniref:hypothetical protein n=1 Tax=Stappia sp. MMSF_3263 TaxID=3046693 RepID=UPI0027401DC2|nr:hypothetical protein [Stappia sp. MMSF_3263]